MVNAKHSHGAPGTGPAVGRGTASVAVLISLVLSTGLMRAGGSTDPASATIRPGKDISWWSRVQEQIQASEYEISWQDSTVIAGLEGVWHAPNRSHNLRTYFTDDGIRVVRRTESDPGWELGLRLIGYGRRESVRPVAKAKLSSLENRIDYDRAEILEWYVNDPQGLEQGFTLAGPPEALAAWGDDGRLLVGGRGVAPGTSGKEEGTSAFLVLALEGSLSPAISADGRAIDFAAPGGARVLHYAQLRVIDERGQELDAWMEGFSEDGLRGIRIVFDDAVAAYPVVVDPLLTSPAWTAESNQPSANFGYAVSTAGDVNGDGYADVIVGAPYYDNGETDEGRAWVYHGSAAGLSTTPAWTAESDQAQARLGSSVATAGDVNGDGYADVIVGALYYDNGELNEGRAWVYHGSASGLVSAWSAEGDQPGACFGSSVSTAGDVNGDGYADVVVGAYIYDNGEQNEGRAYVYHGSPVGLGPMADWMAESDQITANFGESVASAGDVNGDGYADVVVGAPYYTNGENDEGRAYVYHGSTFGLSSTADWIAESNQAGGIFGVSLSTAGDVNGDGYADIIVGTRIEYGSEGYEGRAHVYHGSVSGLSTIAAWTVVSDQPDAAFGRSVSTAGDVNGDGYADVIVGAPEYDNVERDEGKTYVYLGSAGGLGSSAAWIVESAQERAMFGDTVAAAGDVNGDGYTDIIIGAPGYGWAYPDTGEGRAYVYHGSPGGLRDSAGWSANGDQPGESLGISVSTAGDVNGDGYGDVIVGAYAYDNGETNEGRAFVYHGSAVGPSASPDWNAESDQANASFGWSVSTAGDVNGDGYADVIVGADLYENGEAEEGRAFVYHGSPTGLHTTAAWTAESNMVGAFFGNSVSTAGDVNGDGYADVIVGAHFYFNGQWEEGRVYVYHGAASGLNNTADWSIESNQAGANLGAEVATAGDINGDGYDDVIVGATYYENGEVAEGRAFVYHGSASGLNDTADWTAESNLADALFGRSVSTAGDVNGDGYADVIVGASSYSNGELNEGRVYVYHGSSAGLSSASTWSLESDHSDAFYGYSVSTAGDVNADGYADVIVGACLYDNGEVDEGQALVYHGSAVGLGNTADWSVESDQAGSHLGRSVSTAGDVNGDGYADVIVGAYSFDGSDTDTGQALVFYGNDGPGLTLRPQQRRADDLAPIAPGGRSRESGSFRLAALGRTPFGRGRVWPEWEVKPLGQPFDGTGTVQSLGSDSGLAGAVFSELITGLEPGGHHWRVRLRYDPVTTPLQGASRWFTVPWNGWQERDLTISPFLGGWVWEDRDGDGVMQPDEPRLYGVLVQLIDDIGGLLHTKVTAGDGSYRFDVGSGGPLRVRFEAPEGWAFTFPDLGIDDLLDSDADTVTGETALIAPPFDSLDEQRWSAGIRRVGICWPPDETVYIYDVTLTTDGNEYPVLHFQDPNQLSAVTGYNIYRSSDAGLPHPQWSSMADDVIDMDESAPNKQWVDTTGDLSPSDIWYYQVAPYNHECPEQTAEGPW